ncbi:MAG: efflux RND transporter permease subunit, partial [Alphaproteobacteria bacterium]|nr:efflux RND transporter permease subunit [Alphaproteobacteria bacterium]
MARTNATKPRGKSERRAFGSGVIGVFVRHPTAANLLMAVLILSGVFSLTKLNRQFFPDFELPTISVTVPWPGASAEDVETNVLDTLEPELRFLDGIHEVTSIAREGSASIVLEFNSDADLQKAQSDVEQAISQVVTLPEDSERPIVSRATLFDRVARIAISGPFSEQILKKFAKQLRDGLLAAGIDRVTLDGAREEEIWIQVKERDLRRLDLTLDQISQRVRQSTQDLPAGRLEGTVEVQLRSKSERKTPETIRDIEIKSLESGEKIFLKDIATVETRYEREGNSAYENGETAIELTVQRSLTGDTIEMMGIMDAYLAKKLPELPKTLNVKVYDVRGKFVAQRLGILMKNGLQGLVLVLAMLFIFLNARIAFWTAVGIPVALLAALGVMLATGQSINMISMFALIMMLGIIVDDAIVVGEQAATLEEKGFSSVEAAQSGAETMLPPVTAASLTTMAAFMPILFIGDRIGDIMVAIPLVVLSVIIASLIECFLILPGHLRHGGEKKCTPGRLRRGFDRNFARLRDGPFRSFVKHAYEWRYTTVAVLVACFIIAVGALTGGRVVFQFFPSPESENISAKVDFAAGMPRAEKQAALGKITKALYAQEKTLVAELKNNSSNSNARQAFWNWLKNQRPHDTTTPEQRSSEDALVEAAVSVIGRAGRSRGENLGEVNVQLTPSETRSVRTKNVIKAWREGLPAIAGVERIAIAARRGGPPGRDVDVRLQNAPIEILKRASEDLKQALTSVPGVSAITDDLPYGKQEYVFELTPRGQALGFTGSSVGSQVRNAFEGAIAIRFARGEEEVTVRVMRAQEQSGKQDLEHLYLISPSNTRVPLKEVVTMRERRTFSIVQRKDGVRTVAVTGDIDPDVNTTQDVIALLEKDVIPQLAKKYGIEHSYKGRADETRSSFRDLKQGAMLALALIYITLAWVFGSYWKPFAVMLIIPFGFVGAVVGHYLMGYSLTIISMIGLLGLSGILVNDSIVLVSRIKERLAMGDILKDAVIGGAQDRLRAVLLTSLTTIGGLLPLLFETSRQAQFLIPMAVTLVFGLAAATVLVLVLVPALVGIGGDIGHLMQALRRRFFGLKAQT